MGYEERKADADEPLASLPRQLEMETRIRYQGRGRAADAADGDAKGGAGAAQQWRDFQAAWQRDPGAVRGALAVAYQVTSRHPC